jgi:DNA-binding transcriptional MerR regulator
MPEQWTIGELASRTGVAASALRYWERLGLLPAPARVSGHRRYAPSAVRLVGEILVLRDAGYTLRELRALAAAGAGVDDRRALAERTLARLDDRIALAQAARDAVAHALACRHEDVRDCPRFAAVVAARLAGSSLAEAHAQRHPR